MQKLNTELGANPSATIGYLRRNIPEHSGLDGPTVRHLPKRRFEAQIHDAFGPDPDTVLECFIALGLTDAEISRYVGLPEARVSRIARPMRRPDLGKYVD